MLWLWWVGCGDGTEAIRAALEAEGLTVLEVTPLEDGGFDWIGIEADGNVCKGNRGESGTSLGCLSGSTSFSSKVCFPPDSAAGSEIRCVHRHDAAACLAVAVAQYRKGDAAAVAGFAAGCEAGLGAACRDAGVVAMNGELGQPVDLTAAADWFKRGCALQDAKACVALGNAARTAEDPSGCATGALDWFRKAADAGSAKGSNEVGFTLDHCPGGDLAAARAAFDQGCERGEPRSCHNLALMWSRGRGGPTSDDEAYALERRACAAEKPIADACTNQGVREYRRGEGDHGLAAFQRGCEHGAAVACRDAGVVLRDGAGTPKDPAGARTWFGKGCDGGDDVACRNVGRPAPEGSR